MTWEEIYFPAKQWPKAHSKVTQKWFKDNKVNVLEWLSQNPDLDPKENGLEKGCSHRILVQPDRACGEHLDSSQSVKSLAGPLLWLWPKVLLVNTWRGWIQLPIVHMCYQLALLNSILFSLCHFGFFCVCVKNRRQKHPRGWMFFIGTVTVTEGVSSKYYLAAFSKYFNLIFQKTLILCCKWIAKIALLLSF